jgi:hypothetical protein
MNVSDPLELPILTDVVELHTLEPAAAAPDTAESGIRRIGIHSPEELAALQADLVGRALNLTDELLHSAAREMEGVVFERVLDRLRAALPEIVAAALREHLEPRQG